MAKKTAARGGATASADLAALARGLSVSKTGRLEAEPGAPIWAVDAKSRLPDALAALRASGGLDGVSHLDLGYRYCPDPPRSDQDLDRGGDGARALTDLGPLSGLTSLASLDLSGCEQLTDLGPLAGVKALTSLNLWGCKKLTDLGPLSGLKALTSSKPSHGLTLGECEGLPSSLRKTWQSKDLKSLLARLGRSDAAAIGQQAAADLAARLRTGGRLYVGGVVSELSHAQGWVEDARGRERDAYMVEEGQASAYAVFQMPVQAAEAVEAFRAIGQGANILDYKWEGLECTDGKGSSGPYCSKTKRRISGEFHDGGDIKVIELTCDGDPDVEFEAPDGTREPIETDEALSLLKALAAEPGGKAPKKAARSRKSVAAAKSAAKGNATAKASKKAAKKKAQRKSSKKTAKATKKTSKKRSPRR